MSEKKSVVDNPRRWSQALEKSLKNRSVIFWSAITCFAMLGNIGDGQNRVVHAQGNIENDLASTTISGMPYSKVEFRPDSRNELILQKVAEKNLELHQAGIDTDENELLRISILIEAIGKTEGGYTVSNLQLMKQILPREIMQDLIDQGYGGMECVEALTLMGINGLINGNLVIPGNSAYAAIQELQGRQGYRNNREFILGDRGGARVVVPGGIDDPRITDHKKSTWYMLDKGKNYPGHAFMTYYDEKAEMFVKIAANELLTKEGMRIFGDFPFLTVEAMTRDQLREYIETYTGDDFTKLSEVYLLNMDSE